MRCLVVKAHPLGESLCNDLTNHIETRLSAAGHDVEVEDLYASDFAPSLRAEERRSYYGGDYAGQDIAGEIERLSHAEAIVLVFPTWWFGLPAILKGWFDRVWAPGVAFRHREGLGAVEPLLGNTREVFAVTTLGAPWWVDYFIFRQPVKRMLKHALVGPCTVNCQFTMRSLHGAENLEPAQIDGFRQQISKVLDRW